MCINSETITKQGEVADNKTPPQPVEDEAAAKIKTLSKNSSTVANLSLKSRLDLVEELILNIKSVDWLKSGNWTAHEARLIGHTCTVGDDGINEATLSKAAKTEMATLRMNMSSLLVALFETIQKSLQYQVSVQNSSSAIVVPDILSKVRTETTNEGTVQVNGPVPIAMSPCEFEVWSTPSNYLKEKPVENPSEDNRANGVALVLSAGNQSFLGIADALNCFFLHPRKPIFVKHHPLRPFLFELFSTIFAPLSNKGFYDQTLDQGVEHTQQILAMKEVTHIHVTGSFRTVSAIKTFLASSRPYLTQRDLDEIVTSELGCVTPYIVSPGKYTDDELKNLATWIGVAKKTNGGCNCLSVQALVLPEDWKQKDRFRELLQMEFESATTDCCYYPGSLKNKADIVEHYQKLDGKRIRHTKAPFTSDGVAPKSDISGNNDADRNEEQVTIIECGTYQKEGYDGYALKKEAFGPVLAIVELPGGCNEAEYLLNTAVPFVNDKNNIYGSLSCTLATPDSADESITRKALAALQYGSVVLNTYSAFGYLAALLGAVWGAHPRDKTGHSGYGFIGNAYGIKNVEKTVVYGGSLSKSPILDKKTTIPLIVMDAMTEIFLSQSIVRAFFNVGSLLALRLLYTIFAFASSMLKGNRSPGSAL